MHFGSTDPNSAAYNHGANWVGVLFGAYNGFAALAAVIIPLMVRAAGLRVSHLINLFLGGAGLMSFLLISDPHWLLVSMLGVGFAWASILSLPYALLSDSVPAEKMGVYMGIFNFFIVIPQLVAASLLGLLLRTLFGGAPIYALVLGGVSFSARRSPGVARAAAARSAGLSAAGRRGAAGLANDQSRGQHAILGRFAANELHQRVDQRRRRRGAYPA